MDKEYTLIEAMNELLNNKEKYGLNMESLADAIGTNAVNIKYYRDGKTRTIHIDLVKKIKELYGISIHPLYMNTHRRHQ